MGSSQPAWRPLPLPASVELPGLLVSIGTGASDYTIRVTDMANTWTESLERKAICMRAWGENTTIDPSDTPENMAIFLSAVRSALDPTHADHAKTSLSLAAASVKDAGEGGLTLRCTCSIPGLEPLEWPIHLKKAAPSATTTSLVLPLVHGQYERDREVQSLSDMLHDKDRVIGKLIDKLEANGTGLENIFTSLSGKKKISKTAAQARVKGLGPFDRDEWKGAMSRQEGPGSISALLQSVFGSDTRTGPSYSEAEGIEGLDKWWLDLQGTLKIPRDAQASAASQRSEGNAKPATPEPVADDDDDDFQVQETPPHLKGKGAKEDTSNKVAEADKAVDDMSTESDEDEPAPTALPKRKDIPEQPKPSAPVARRIGAIGSKKEAPKEEEPPTKPHTTQGQDLDGSETASDAEGDNDETASEASEAPAAKEPPPEPPTPRTGRLGRIGGQRAKSPPKPMDEEKEVAPSKDDSSEGVAHRPRKLGMIGQGKRTQQATNEDDGARGRSAGRDDTEKARETSTERADRKREELKRELEKKAAAGPSKKKRRF